MIVQLDNEKDKFLESVSSLESDFEDDSSKEGKDKTKKQTPAKKSPGKFMDTSAMESKVKRGNPEA